MMEEEKKKIKSFTDLNAWKEAHTLVLMVYTAAKDFPNEEQFGLINQLRCAAVSITSNIAEGFSRSSYKDKAHFYATALGSLTEVQNQLLVARDVGYLHNTVFNSIADQTVMVSKLLNGLIKSSKQNFHNS